MHMIFLDTFKRAKKKLHKKH